MNTDVAIFVTAVANLFFGWAFAAAIYGRRYYKTLKIHANALTQAYSRGYDAGSEAPTRIGRYSEPK